MSLAKTHLQADIDFVTSPLPRITKVQLDDKVQIQKLLSDQLLAESELIKIVSEVIGGCGRYDYEIRLTHASLLHACLKQINISQSLLSQSLQMISAVLKFSPFGSTRTDKWSSIQTALEGLSLSSSEIRNWKRFVTRLSGQSHSVIPELQAALSNNGQSTISASLSLAFEELLCLISLLEKWQLDKGRIAIEPMMVPSNDYYSGIYFQVRLVDVFTKRTTIVAIGGRYRSPSKLKHDKGISL